METFLLGFGAIGLLVLVLAIELFIIVIGASIIDIEILYKWWGWIIGFILGNIVVAIAIGVIYLVGSIIY